jgi:hypothetical protein
MLKKTELKITLISALILLSLGGWIFHFRIHPLSAGLRNLIPFSAGIISVIIVPFLFSWRRTIHLAYLLNGMIVIIGVITMSHFSLSHLPDPVSAASLLLQTTVPDIMFLWTKFALGKAIFTLNLLHADSDPAAKMKWYRYPASGWWLIHLLSMSTVYTLGNILWR